MRRRQFITGRTNRRAFIAALGGAAVSPLVARAQGGPPGPMQTEKPISIAVVTFVSGRAAGPFGLPGRNAAELLVEAINMGGVLPAPYASKGFAGRRLSLTVYDEAGSPGEQAELFRKIHANGADCGLRGKRCRNDCCADS